MPFFSDCPPSLLSSMRHSRPSHHPSLPPLAPITRPQSPRVLSCDAQLRPFCSSLPERKAWPVFSHTQPKCRMWYQLGLIEYHILFLSSLNLLSQALKILPAGSPTQFYSLEALFQLTVLRGLRITAVPSAPCVRILSSPILNFTNKTVYVRNPST